MVRAAALADSISTVRRYGLPLRTLPERRLPADSSLPGQLADQLAAPGQFTDQPTPGKWWLKRDAQEWGAPDGKILLAGQPNDKPAKEAEWRSEGVDLFNEVTEESIAEVLARCVAFDPAMRPASAREVALRLGGLAP